MDVLPRLQTSRCVMYHLPCGPNGAAEEGGSQIGIDGHAEVRSEGTSMGWLISFAARLDRGIGGDPARYPRALKSGAGSFFTRHSGEPRERMTH